MINTTAHMDIKYLVLIHIDFKVKDVLITLFFSLNFNKFKIQNLVADAVSLYTITTYYAFLFKIWLYRNRCNKRKNKFLNPIIIH